jgi:hypothetical protein
VVVLVGTVYISTSLIDAWFTLYTSLPARDPVTKKKLRRQIAVDGKGKKRQSKNSCGIMQRHPVYNKPGAQT